MKPICVVFHGLFELGNPPAILPNAINIIKNQMFVLEESGLLDACSEFIVGINGGETSRQIANLIIPAKAKIVMHGLQCRSENRTILELEKWLHGHEDWYVLYFHAKGCTHPPNNVIRTNWRLCMMRHLVWEWRKCVRDLEWGFDAVGCHWHEPPRTPPGQRYFAGTFFFAKASFLVTLPSIMLRDRIKLSGIDALESRFEAEVFIGNGPITPKIRDYHPGWFPTCNHHP